LTFRKLKITTTSHQQQETLFCVKFELRRYSGDDEFTVIDSVHSSPVCVLSHSTQMKPVPSVSSIITEVIPASGNCDGGTRVAILGNSFVDSPATRIRFDTIDVMPTFHGPGTLLCYTPQHPPGSVSVRVSNSPKKWSDTQAVFTYHDHYSTYQKGDQITLTLSPPNHFDEGMGGDWPSNNGFDSMKDSDAPGGSLQFNALDSRGFNSLHYSSSMGEIEKARLLIKNGASINIVDKSGNTPLHWACVEGQTSIAQFLLEHGATSSMVNDLGISPLLIAVEQGQSEMVSLLLQNQTSVNTTTLHGLTPLHKSATLSDTDILSSLIKCGAFLNAQDDEGDTSLHWAVRAGRVDSANILLNNGISVDVANDDLETALHLAVSCGDEQFVELLVKCNASIDERDAEACTPLHLACMIANEKIVKLLVDNGANVNTKDFNGQTPLHIAIQNGQKSLASYLESVGAISVQDKYGNMAKFKEERNSIKTTKLPETRLQNKSANYSSNPFVQKASAFNKIHGVTFSFIDV